MHPFIIFDCTYYARVCSLRSFFSRYLIVFAPLLSLFYFGGTRLVLAEVVGSRGVTGKVSPSNSSGTYSKSSSSSGRCGMF